MLPVSCYPQRMETIVPAQFANHPDLTNGAYGKLGRITGDDALLSDILTHTAQHGFPLATEWYEPTESGSLDRKQCVELVWRNSDGDALLRSSVFGIRNTPKVFYEEMREEMRKIGPTGLTLPAYPGYWLRHPKEEPVGAYFFRITADGKRLTTGGPGNRYYKVAKNAELTYEAGEEFEQIRDQWSDSASQTGVVRRFRFTFSQVGAASQGPLGNSGQQQYAYCWLDVSKVDGNGRPSQLA